MKPFFKAIALSCGLLSNFFMLKWAIWSTYYGTVTVSFNDYGEGNLEIFLFAFAMLMLLWFLFSEFKRA